MDLDRRRFLHLGSALAAALATGSLTACSGDDGGGGAENGGAPGAGTATTARGGGAGGAGGSVKVALLASPTDTLNPSLTTGLLDYAVLFAVHDSLVLLKGDRFEYQLAESIEPNADGSEWTIVLRDGPTFHDGRSVAAADVVYSLNLYGASPSYGQFFALIDLPNVRAGDERTVVVPMVTPRADLVESVLGQLSMVVPDGFDEWGANIGSGPFTLESYETGVGAAVVRNPDYWAGAPALERIEFVSIGDAATKANALAGGEVQFAGGLDAAAAATLAGTDGVRVLRGGATNSTIRCFAFNRTTAPFDDPRVIEACKLAVDRQQLIDVIAFGNATLGNDMPSLGFDGYPDDVPQRRRDVARATALFAEAGVNAFTIVAADFLPGIVASAELYAQHLAECGVTATVEKGDPATYFSDFAKVVSTPCQAFYFINRPAATLLSSYTGSASAFNVFGSGDPTYDAALGKALATLDDESRRRAVTELLETVRDTEGWLIWGFEDQIDGAVAGLQGVELSQGVPGFARATLR